MEGEQGFLEDCREADKSVAALPSMTGVVRLFPFAVQRNWCPDRLNYFPKVGGWRGGWQGGKKGGRE